MDSHLLPCPFAASSDLQNLTPQMFVVLLALLVLLVLMAQVLLRKHAKNEGRLVRRMQRNGAIFQDVSLCSHSLAQVTQVKLQTKMSHRA